MNSKKKPKMIIKLRVDDLPQVSIPIFSQKDISIKLNPLYESKVISNPKLISRIENRSLLLL